MRKAHPPFVFPLSDFARSFRFSHEQIMNMCGKEYERFMNLNRGKNEKCMSRTPNGTLNYSTEELNKAIENSSALNYAMSRYQLKRIGNFYTMPEHDSMRLL